MRHPLHLPERPDQAHEVEPVPEEDRDGRRGDDHQEAVENDVDKVEAKRRYPKRRSAK